MDTGYTDKPVERLTNAQLVEEFLQSGYDSGYFAAYFNVDGKAISRRNECQQELTRRLEAAEKLAEALRHMIDGIADEYDPAFCHEQLSSQDRRLLDMAVGALAAWEAATRG